MRCANRWQRRWPAVDTRPVGAGGRAAPSGLLERFRQLEQEAEGGMPLAQAMRLLSGATRPGRTRPTGAISAGPLAGRLSCARPARSCVLAAIDPGRCCMPSCVPISRRACAGCTFDARLGLGACLPTIMGLGKTIQVLASLLVLKKTAPHAGPSLAGGAGLAAGQLAAGGRALAPACAACWPIRRPWRAPSCRRWMPMRWRLTTWSLPPTASCHAPRPLAAQRWRLAVIDEAQAIKNPAAQQTRAVKKLQAGTRIALTGTPVENRLSDLWSIFDFTHPGLLGSERVLPTLPSAWANRPVRAAAQPGGALHTAAPEERQADHCRPARQDRGLCLVQPERRAGHALPAGRQAWSRRWTSPRAWSANLVLSFLMRLKQICNHPSQWLGDGAWAPGQWQFARLREIAETVAARQEKMLVFTQFRETTRRWRRFTAACLGARAWCCMAARPWQRRRQTRQALPAGRAAAVLRALHQGRRLRAESDRRLACGALRPLVEPGRGEPGHRPRLPHRPAPQRAGTQIITRGTIEERIDALIQAKQQLVQDVVEGGGEINLTEMSDAALMDLVKLDINAAGCNHHGLGLQTVCQRGRASGAGGQGGEKAANGHAWSP